MAGMVAGGGGGALPPLRDELQLYPGPVSDAGSPTWTLHDPAAQRFFRLGWMETEILQRWRLGSAETIAAAISRETTLQVRPEQVGKLVEFVSANNLIVVDTVAGALALAEQQGKRKANLFKKAFHSYLFIRIPLVRPDRFLADTLPWVRWVFSPVLRTVMAVLAILAAYLISRQWDLFKDTFAGMFTVTGALLAAAALGLSKVIHEMGHAYAAKNLGLRVPTMGVSLMCFAPVLWTDTTEAWKTPHRSDRLSIGLAGVSLELMVAVLAALLWPLMPPGNLKTAVFIAAGTIWIMTLAVNANPCMRYDGYYLLSDYWDMPDLQTRAFALAKWRLREWIFGWGLPPPERLPAWDREKLILYAWCTWLYRFFLFLGIALMMYHLFFKALGVVLMVVELVFFLAAPVWREVMQWIRMREHLRFTLRLVRSALLLAAFAGVFFLPWHRQVIAPAILVPARQTMIFAPGHGCLEKVAVENYQRVAAQDTVVGLASPDLDNQIRLAEMRIANHLNTLSLTSLDRQLRADLASDWEELGRLAEDLGGLLREHADLTVRAPIPGTVRDLPVWVTDGQWLAAREAVAVVAGGTMRVDAYVDEDEWDRIAPGQTGRFYPLGRGRAPVPVRVISIERQATREVTHPELSSTNGGPLGAHKVASGDLVPDHAVFKVMCEVTEGTPATVIAGQVSITGEPRSLAAALWRNLLGLLVRESNLS